MKRLECSLVLNFRSDSDLKSSLLLKISRLYIRMAELNKLLIRYKEVTLKLSN